MIKTTKIATKTMTVTTTITTTKTTTTTTTTAINYMNGYYRVSVVATISLNSSFLSLN